MYPQLTTGGVGQGELCSGYAKNVEILVTRCHGCVSGLLRGCYRRHPTAVRPTPSQAVMECLSCSRSTHVSTADWGS